MNPDSNPYADYIAAKYAEKLREDRTKQRADEDRVRKLREYLKQKEQADFYMRAQQPEKIIGMTPGVSMPVLDIDGKTVGEWTVHSLA